LKPGEAAACITPVKDMENLLQVESFDQAGNRSGDHKYWFWVRPVGDSWSWSFESGAGTSALSYPIANAPLTMSPAGAQWITDARRGEGAVRFNGSGSMTTILPILDTARPSGFSVSAWVRMPGPEPTPSSGPDPSPTPDVPPGDDPDGDDSAPPPTEDPSPEFPAPDHNEVAVSEDGANTSMFTLGYRNDVDLNQDAAGDPAWCFTVAVSDSATAQRSAACVQTDGAPGQWVHLAGVLAPATDGTTTIQLFVNGTTALGGIEARAAAGQAWRATGALAVGRGWSAGPRDGWTGDVDEVRVAPRVWSLDEIDWQARPPQDDVSAEFDALRQ
jgi:hypothetical protein